jgi:hypothetical protein
MMYPLEQGHMDFRPFSFKFCQSDFLRVALTV